MRAGLGLALALLATGASARAAADDDPLDLDVSFEAGTELDSNPHRESSSQGNSASVPAAVGRGGARLSLGWRPAPRRSLRVSAVGAAKKFVGLDGSDDAAGEDVAVIAIDASANAGLSGRPVALGARVSYYDAIERDDSGGAADHDFRTGDGSLSLSLRGEDDQRGSLAVGVRGFQYKPDTRYDFTGEHVQLAWRKSFVSRHDEVEDGTTWDLGVEYGLYRRAYNDVARVDTCAPGQALEAGCLASTDLPRVDQLHMGAASLDYTGERIYGARYELSVNLSNSFGQSLLRHRLELSATTETWFAVFLTARVTVQFNQFLDPLLLSRDIGVLTIEDENRNSVVLHFTRELGTHWEVEARYGFYANEFATSELSFRRQTGYLGLVYKL